MRLKGETVACFSASSSATVFCLTGAGGGTVFGNGAGNKFLPCWSYRKHMCQSRAEIFLHTRIKEIDK